MSKLLVLKVIDNEDSPSRYGEYRFYCKDNSIHNICNSFGITPIVGESKEDLPEMNEGYHLSWSGYKTNYDELFKILECYYSEIFYCEENKKWGEIDYISSIIKNKESLGVCGFFE